MVIRSVFALARLAGTRYLCSFAAIGLCMLLVIGVVGCGGGSTDSAPAMTGNGPQVTTPPADPPPASPTSPSPPASPPAATGTARLAWSAPTTNTDGTVVTDLAGYVIQYGNSPTLLAQQVSISDPSVKSYTLTGLGSGTWYFALSSYTVSGVYSALSNVASKTIE